VTVVLDADVVIGALDRSDAHHAEARRRFAAWQSDRTPRVIALVNLTEVLVGPASEPQRLRAAREAIAALGIGVQAPTEAIAVDAARLRATHPISLPDAYALATARHVGGRVASFDERLVAAATTEGLA
jgi:predicted nucleic acid-binding protein